MTKIQMNFKQFNYIDIINIIKLVLFGIIIWAIIKSIGIIAIISIVLLVIITYIPPIIIIIKNKKKSIIDYRRFSVYGKLKKGNYISIKNEDFDINLKEYESDESIAESNLIFPRGWFEDGESINISLDNKERAKNKYIPNINKEYGEYFENYVVSLFPERDYEIIFLTPSTFRLKGREINSQQKPDILVKHRDTKTEFYVECKFRSKWPEDSIINWCKEHQLKKYSNENLGKKCIIILGVGIESINTNDELKPKECYRIPSWRLTKNIVTKEYAKDCGVMDLEMSSIRWDFIKDIVK